MIKTETTTIDGDRYSVAQLGAREGRRILVKLTRLFGPALGRLVAGGPQTGEAISEAIAEFSAGATEADLEDLCRTFGQSTELEVEGKPLLLDIDMQELHFAGRYAAMFSWLAFCLKVNYSDFFDSLGAAQGKLAARLQGQKESRGSRSPSSSRRTGSSGAS